MSLDSPENSQSSDEEAVPDMFRPIQEQIERLSNSISENQALTYADLEDITLRSKSIKDDLLKLDHKNSISQDLNQEATEKVWWNLYKFLHNVYINFAPEIIRLRSNQEASSEISSANQFLREFEELILEIIDDKPELFDKISQAGNNISTLKKLKLYSVKLEIIASQITEDNFTDKLNEVLALQNRIGYWFPSLSKSYIDWVETQTADRIAGNGFIYIISEQPLSDKLEYIKRLLIDKIEQTKHSEHFLKVVREGVMQNIRDVHLRDFYSLVERFNDLEGHVQIPTLVQGYGQVVIKTEQNEAFKRQIIEYSKNLQDIIDEFLSIVS